MITVCIESPLVGDFTTNLAYARAAMLYCLQKGVSPYASHLLLPQIFDDLDVDRREQGIQAGIVMGNMCDSRWYFIDLNDGAFTGGMYRAAVSAPACQTSQHVTLGDDWRTKYRTTPTPGFGG